MALSGLIHRTRGLMLTLTRSRFVAAAIAAAVVGAGLFAAAPANAATAEITLASTVFTEGDWGSGLSISGSGFTADSTVIVVLTLAGSVVESTTVAADASGDFTLTNWVPVATPEASTDDETTKVTATDAAGIDSNDVDLSIRRTAGVLSNVTTISSTDLMDPNGGIAIVASGFQPGESVTINAVYDGDNVLSDSDVADAAGSVYTGGYLASGVAEAGSITFTITSATHTETVTIQVTGAPAGAGTGTAGLKTVPAAPAGAPKRPVVSG
jgi:hypothetical protein